LQWFQNRKAIFKKNVKIITSTTKVI